VRNTHKILVEISDGKGIGSRCKDNSGKRTKKKCKQVKVKLYPCNRPWRPVGL
jgi:hypothetical protein